jgi:hypothetical protein
MKSSKASSTSDLPLRVSISAFFVTFDDRGAQIQ